MYKARPGEIGGIKGIPSPTNRQELQSVLGAFGYYSRSEHRYATYMNSFRNLLSQKNKFKWSEYRVLASTFLLRTQFYNSIMADFFSRMGPGRIEN